jgi:hypothetical protein
VLYLQYLWDYNFKMLLVPLWVLIAAGLGYLIPRYLERRRLRRIKRNIFRQIQTLPRGDSHHTRPLRTPPLN